jgi:hypothetical protein
VANQPHRRNRCTNAAVTAITAPTNDIAAIIAPTPPTQTLCRRRRCNRCADEITAPMPPPQ